MEQQQQSLDAFQRSIPDVAKQTGMTEDQVRAVGPQGVAEIMSKIAEANAGVGGGPAWMAQQRAEKALIAQGQPIPWTPGDPASYAAWNAANTGQAVTTAKTKADDLVADQHNFAPALGNYDKAIGLIDQFNTPDMKEAAKEFLGTGGSIRPVATMDPKSKAAWALYKQIMGSQFAAGTQDFKGAGRITQQELNQDLPSQSTMGQLNQDPTDFFNGVASVSRAARPAPRHFVRRGAERRRYEAVGRGLRQICPPQPGRDGRPQARYPRLQQDERERRRQGL